MKNAFTVPKPRVQDVYATTQYERMRWFWAEMIRCLIQDATAQPADWSSPIPKREKQRALEIIFSPHLAGTRAWLLRHVDTSYDALVAAVKKHDPEAYEYAREKYLAEKGEGPLH